MVVMRLLLFDVDGTLIETRGAGRRALSAAMLEVFGEAGTIEGHEFRGKTDPAIVRELLRGAGWDDRRIDAEMPGVWGPYLRELEAALATSELRPAPCPGVRVLLERLSGNDRYALGLLTGNVEEGAERKLRAAGLAGRFAIGAFGSDSERRADLPRLAARRASRHMGREFRAEDAILIGDTPEDVRCARACGSRAVAVATGGYDVEALRSYRPDVVLDDFLDTEAVLAALEAVASAVVPGRSSRAL